MYPHFVRRQQVAAAVGRQRDIGRAAYKNYDLLARLCSVGPGDLEQPPRQTVDLTVSTKTFLQRLKRSSLQLLVPLKTLV